MSSVALHRIGLGLLLIFFFSLGLAAALIGVGVLAVSASSLADRFSGDSKWSKFLTPLSALVVMLVGIGFVFNAMVAAGIVSLNL